MAVQQESVDGRFEERLERLERLLEAMLARPIQVHVTLPKTDGTRQGVACSLEAEIRAILDAVYDRVCTETGEEGTRACREFRVVLNDMRMHGVETIRRRYGI